MRISHSRPFAEPSPLLLSIRESAGQTSADQPRHVIGEPMSAEQTKQLLDRLPPRPPAEDAAKEVNLVAQPIPPPRPGTVVRHDFTPDDTQPAPSAEAGTLDVVRMSPDGPIDIAPFLSVTFNRPMIPLGTHTQLSAADVPVQLDPPLAGEWQWRGTHTLRFDAVQDGQQRFPMATVFTATIPAGTAAVDGSELPETVTWQFSTPRLAVTNFWPKYNTHKRDTVFLLCFNQRIDPAALLPFIQVTSSRRPIPVRIATAEEIAANDAVTKQIKASLPKRTIALRAVDLLPAASTIRVQLKAGAPSAEGPLTAHAAEVDTFNTYDVLKITDHSGKAAEQPRPRESLRISFNNHLDAEAFKSEWVTIDPPLPSAHISTHRNTLFISGNTKAGTTLKVTIHEAIRDTHGQTLGKAQTLVMRIGNALPTLFSNQTGLITIDPYQKQPVYRFSTCNFKAVRVRVSRVQPTDLADFSSRRTYRDVTDLDQATFKNVVFDNEIQISAEPNELVETALDLSPWLTNGVGQLAITVNVPRRFYTKELRRNWRIKWVTHAWFQVTQIGLDAIHSYRNIKTWVTHLKDGAPLPDVKVGTFTQPTSATTDENGLATIRIGKRGAEGIMAQLGDDIAFLTFKAAALPRVDNLVWHIVDDRQTYKPGETVTLKGWVRLVEDARLGDVRPFDLDKSAVNWAITDSRRNKLRNGTVELLPSGCFDFNFELPEQMPLGDCALRFDLPGKLKVKGVWINDTHHHTISVQEFRRPEFEVSTSVKSSGPHVIGQSAEVTTRAAYYAGGGLGGAPVNWSVSSKESSYSPPGWRGYSFGRWRPWWLQRDDEDEDLFLPFDIMDNPDEFAKKLAGTTDISGEHHVTLDFEVTITKQPATVRTAAHVEDVNRQTWSSSSSLLVHPASCYVGLRGAQNFVRVGTPLVLDAIVVDIDGSVASGRDVRVTAERTVYKYHKRRWQEVVVETQSEAFVSADDPTPLTFAATDSGVMRITATVTDANGKEQSTIMRRWIGSGLATPSQKLEQEELTLIPNYETLAPGDSAEILVQSPFANGNGLLTISHNGALQHETFDIVDHVAMLSIPIKEAHLPNLHTQVDVVGHTMRTNDVGQPLPELPPRPAFATASLNLPISLATRTLLVKAIPEDDQLAPAGSTTINVSVTDAANTPLSAVEVTAFVVDEAILALSGYTLKDPIKTFYTKRRPMTSSHYGRKTVRLSTAEGLSKEHDDPEGFRSVDSLLEKIRSPIMMRKRAALSRSAPPMPMAASFDAMEMMDISAGAEMSFDMDSDEPIAVRSDFNPLAHFSPTLLTDENGQIAIEITVPDNLTRYRIMVIAVEGNRFGIAESNLTARLPLMVRPSPPRFLNFGDSCELPFVIQNQTDVDLPVALALRTDNLTLPDPLGRIATVPANDRIELRIPATTAAPGTALFDAVTVAKRFADAAHGTFPVYTPATTEAFATYGVLDDGVIAQQLTRPTDVVTQFGGLEIQTTSTALASLTDAVHYLIHYRFNCTEQVASRLLALAALDKMLPAFNADGMPSAEALRTQVTEDVQMLRARQNGDGGFDWWSRGRESSPYISIHVAHALVRLQHTPHAGDQSMLNKAMRYLENIKQHIPKLYSDEGRASVQAYALYVRHLAGENVKRAATKLYRSEAKSFSLEACAWVWMALGSSGFSPEGLLIRRSINNRAVDTASKVTFTNNAHESSRYVILASSRRTDAVVLSALIAQQRDSDLIPKVVAGLEGHRVRGRWRTTQENAFVLLALHDYFEAFEKQSPNFVARVWLGEHHVLSQAYEKRSGQQDQLTVPMSAVVQQEDTSVVTVAHEGIGRLYYRLGLRYAPASLALDALDRGFIVDRVYEAVDEAEDVTQLEDGRWQIKAGARVRIKLTMTNLSRRHHVALSDPLPAGLEIINPDLKVSAGQSAPNQSSGWWFWTWYNHQNLRDERAEAFATYLWAGTHTYTYTARATTPGQYIVPPAKAEEMYEPEVFGRSSTAHVIIADSDAPTSKS